MPKFTTEQAAIIDAAAGNILISAAAGSGKTTVMVERIISRIRQGKSHVSNLLVLTFTDAAASNMKAKISKNLHDAIRTSTNPDERARLSSQALYLPYAKISTIHAFCLSVVREYAFLLDPLSDGIEAPDADFRTADQTESDELFQRAMDAVLETFYLRLEALDAKKQESDESDEVLESDFSDKEKEEARIFLNLLDSYAGSKSDESIKTSIKQCYTFLRSMPDYMAWVERELNEVALAARDFENSRAAAILRRRLRTAIEAESDALDLLTDLLLDPMTELMSTKTRAGIGNNEEKKAECLAAVKAIRTLLKQLELDPMLTYEAIQNQLKECLFPRISRYKGMEDRNTISDMIRYRMSAITGFYEIHKDAPRGTLPAYALDKAAIEDDLRAMYPVLEALFMLVRETDKQYALLKNEQAVIDFNDFEHIALALLRKPEVIDLYIKQIHEIYVDEYQDTSSIQNSIIEAVSRNNLFLVGDIKQSIYRFRHARPELFQQKMHDVSIDKSLGEILKMSQNFRSVSGILAAVNSVFERVMEYSSGQIDYLDGHALQAFHPDALDVPEPVEFILIDKGVLERDSDDSEPVETEDENDGVELSAIEEEGRLIGDIIIKESYGRGNPLAPSFSDITILCFTHAHAAAISAELTRQGFPVSGEEDSAYLESNELRLMEALMNLLGNELQDLPLLSCMRQLPVFGNFTDEELMEIKAFSLRHDNQRNPYAHYHEAVSYYLAEGPNGYLRDRLSRFKEWIESLRQASVYLSLNELIALIYQESALPEAVAAETEGAKRVENLQNFQKWASDFEGRGRRGLAYFVRYLAEKRKRGVTISPFEIANAADNSIRVITFHKSKGLEFPLVFIVGMDRKLISSRPQGSGFVDLSEKGGIAFQIRRPDRILAYPSIITQALREELDDAAFAEAMRLLYVAMTRAERKLYMISSLKRSAKKTQSTFERRIERFAMRQLALEDKLGVILQRTAYDRRDLLDAKTYADLIFMSQIADYPDLYRYFVDGEGGSSETRGPWRFVVLNTGQAWPFETTLTSRSLAENHEPGVADPTLVSEEAIDEAAFQEICRSYLSVYPYQPATVTPQKFAVSELKRRMQADNRGLGDSDEGLASEATDGKPLGGLAGAGINTQLDDWLSPSWRQKQDEKQELAPNERGTALHTVLRFLDVAAMRGKTTDDIESALTELRNETVLNQEELEAVLPFSENIRAYIDSDLAKEIMEVEAAGGQIYREIPFTLAQPITTFMPRSEGLADDKVMIQGIIDLWYSKDGESILVDYKSDQLRGSASERISTLTARYQLQLELYSRAIQAATGKFVKKRLIWSIPDACIYEIEALSI